MTASPPKGVALAPDERIAIGEHFMYSTLAFYLKTELTLTNRRFIAARPNTVLGLIPVGTSRASYPLENIAGVSAGTRFDLIGVLLGGIGILFGLGGLGVEGARVFGVLLILVGASVVINAPKQWVEVMNSGGGAVRFPVSALERGRTLEFAGRVSEAIARAPRSYGVGSMPAPEARPSSDQSLDPGAALRRLDALKSQGLVTDAEYDATRKSILERL